MTVADGVRIVWTIALLVWSVDLALAARRLGMMRRWMDEQVADIHATREQMIRDRTAAQFAALDRDWSAPDTAAGAEAMGRQHGGDDDA